jgi:hypothetical protein
MSLNTIDTQINLSQIEDQVALLLHAHGAIPERSEVVSIDFGDPDDQNVVPLKVTIQNGKEVKQVG